jgi:hypothetical protein
MQSPHKGSPHSSQYATGKFPHLHISWVFLAASICHLLEVFYIILPDACQMTDSGNLPELHSIPENEISGCCRLTIKTYGIKPIKHAIFHEEA